MVNIQYPELVINGALMNASAPAAYVTPTAFAGLSVEFGADSCSDHPDPSRMTGRVFIPDYHKHFYPDLNDPAVFRAFVNEIYVRTFYGLIDSMTIKDEPGDPYPAGFPNARDMISLDGWSFTRGTDPATAANVPATFTMGGSHIEVSTPLKTTAPPAWVFITSPRAPIDPAKQYRVTALARPVGSQVSANRPIRFDLLWYDAAGTLVTTFEDYSHAWNVSPGYEWQLLYSERFFPPSGIGAVSVAVRVWLTIDDYEPGSVAVSAGVDGLTLHEDTKKDPMRGQRRAPGRMVTFTASDITATAGRLMIGGLPFPEENAYERMQRINGLVSPAFEVVTYDDGETMLAYRDLDNQSSLEVIRRVGASTGNVVMASNLFGARIIGYGDAARYGRVLRIPPGGMAAVIADPLQINLPAAAILDSDLTTSITGLSNQVQFNYRTPTEDGSEDATAVASNAASIRQYGPMARSIDTDLPAASGRAWDKARALVTAQAKPVYGLSDRVRLVESQIPDDESIAQIFVAQKAFRALINIPQAPALIGQYQRIKSGVINIGKELTIALDIEPEGQIVPDAIIFGDLYSSAEYAGVTLPKYANVLIGDIATTSKNIAIF